MSRRSGVPGESTRFSTLDSGVSARGLLTLALGGTWRVSRPLEVAMMLASFFWQGVGGSGEEGGGDGGENQELKDVWERDVPGGESKHVE